MLQERRYSISEIRNILSESGEFKPKYGKNVAKGDNSEGDKAVEELQNEIDKRQPKVKERKNNDLTNNGDFNRTLIDLRYVTEPSKEYTERVEAQIKGYAGKREYDDHKNDEYGNANFEGNKNFLQVAKERANKFNDDQNKIANSGLKSRELEKKGLGTEKKTTFDGKGDDKYTKRGDDKKDNENKEVVAKAKEKELKENRLKVLNFKHTRFLSESQVIKRVPEEYKTDGNRFIIKDCTNTEYLLECRVDPTFGYKVVNVINRVNKGEINEEFKRIKSLYDYKSSNENKQMNVNERKLENSEVEKMLDIMRKIKQ